MTVLTELEQVLGPGDTHLDGMPDHLAQTRSALANAAAAWSRQDPLAALRWAETLPDPNYRLAAVSALGSRSAEAPDPAAHAAYLEQIRDPALRKAALDPHLRHWLGSDAPAARAWLDAHDLFSEAEAAALIRDATRKPF